MRTFPIFIDVERKPPLVTGGGDPAAGRVEDAVLSADLRRAYA